MELRRQIKLRYLDVGDNKPCACGSGKKQKKCHVHGAPIYGPWLKDDPYYFVPKEITSQEKLEMNMFLASVQILLNR